MKKHKKHEHNLLSERLCDEFNEANNIRELALIAHLYVEYYINEIIVMALKKPNLVIDDNELGSFKNKMLLLQSLGFFEHEQYVLQNIALIQRIRNHFAHNLLISEEVPNQIFDRIKQLIYSDNGKICKYDVPWCEHSDPLHAQLHVCSVATTNELIRIIERGVDQKIKEKR